jgi:thiamine-monophosphate kinase
LRTVPEDLPSAKSNRSRPAGRARKLPGEFELIARLCARLPSSRRTILSIGDDCAILAARRAQQLFTIDSMVEGVHFNRAWGTPEQTGARSLAVNLSDIAAMGGVPTACVVNLAVRPDIALTFLDRLYSGLAREARRAGVDIVGGNVTSARELSITIALLGDAPPRPLRRDAARVGDEIFVTGTLGDAAAGWRILAGQIRARDAARRHLVGRYLAPTARLEAGRRLATIRPAAAAIDVSDGLWQDLGHILERSGVGAEVDPAAVPVSPAYRKVMGADLSLALGGGEDYELLFCLRPGHSAASLSRALGLRVARVGKIVRGSGARLTGGGAPKLLGWDQLRSGG